MKAILPFIIILCLFTGIINAQTAVVKGIINDENGRPIEGVAITYNDTGSTSNSKGEYSIEVPSGKFIIISPINVKPSRIKVDHITGDFVFS